MGVLVYMGTASRNISIILILIFLFVNISSSSVVITVDDDHGKDYVTIQEAINAANDTDTILVYPGMYVENVIVNRSVSIVSQSGDPNNTVVLAADDFENAFNVTKGDVSIMGFNITGVRVGPSCGVYVGSVENVKIVNNHLIDNPTGVRLNASNACNITSNLAISNGFDGILLYKSGNNTILHNVVSESSNGIYLASSCNNNTLINNTVLNSKFGIWISSSDHNILTGNNASFNQDGFYIGGSDNNILSNNTALSNTDKGVLFEGGRNNTLAESFVADNLEGIYLRSSKNSTVYDNNASYNKNTGIIILQYSENNEVKNNTFLMNGFAGVHLKGVNDTLFMGNTVHSNGGRGIYLEKTIRSRLNLNLIQNNTDYGIELNNSLDSIIFNNYLNNTNNSLITGTGNSNVWNISKIIGPNIVGGSYMGGNYWAKPDGTGFSQMCKDTNNDGFCDLPFKLDENNTDFLPLNINFSIDIEKHINGTDSDSPIGVVLRENETVIWEYIVNNTGNVMLTDITVTDDKLGPICVIESLFPGQDSVCTASGIVEYGPHDNMATVLASYASVGVDILLMDQDPAHFFGADPSIDVEKYTNGFDIDKDFVPGVYIGDTVNWEYIVTNTGNVTLSNIKLLDDMEGSIPCPVNSLAPGESMLCKWEATAEEYGLYHNTVNVTADFEGFVVIDEDQGIYYGAEKDDAVWEAPAVPTASPFITAGILGLFVVFTLSRKDK